MKIQAKLYYVNQKGVETPVRGEINHIIEGEEVTKLIMSTGIVIDIDLNTHTLTLGENGNYYTQLKGGAF